MTAPRKKITMHQTARMPRKKESSTKLRYSLVLVGVTLVIICAQTVLRLAPRASLISIQVGNKSTKELDLIHDFTLSFLPDNVTNAMKIPTPVFVLSLPKSGTSSLQTYFNCGLSSMKKRHSAHHWGKKSNGKRDKLGNCFRYNHESNRPLTEGCGNYSVWIDAGIPSRDNCFYPGLDALDTIARHHPRSTILLGTRSAFNWLKSAQDYDRASLIQRWTNNCPHFPNVNPGDSEQAQSVWLDFYHNYTQRIRTFAKDHPSITYLQVDLENSKQASTELRQAIGFDEYCFQKCRPGGIGCVPITA